MSRWCRTMDSSSLLYQRSPERWWVGRASSTREYIDGGYMPQIRGVMVGVLVMMGMAACTPLDEDEELEIYEAELWQAEPGNGLVAPRGPAAADGGGRTGGDWIANGLGDPSISGVDPAYALSSSYGLGTDGWLSGNDPQGEDVVRYMVECALPQTESVLVEDADGTPLFTFQGLLGLAPEWQLGSCNTECQQWVSACLMARTNTSGQTVTVFIQGTHPVLGFGVAPEYPNYEATFFGNLFDDPESAHACQGDAVGLTAAAAFNRTCAQDPEECGFAIYTDCVTDAH
ncbi:MAG: hypothetical protein KDK70_02385, partial [Myxococcales bacterium]|nr:hypothetical protein [Myxococcales bacterium]